MTPRHSPFADDSFDVVLSAIGVMFTADHDRAAAELVRVCRPGGRLGLASWTPTGFVGQMLKIVGKHVPPPPAAQPPTRWGVEEIVGELLGDRVHDVASYTASVTQRFASPEAFADFFLTHYGPTHSRRRAARRPRASGPPRRPGQARARDQPRPRRQLRQRLGLPGRHRGEAVMDGYLIGVFSLAAVALVLSLTVAMTELCARPAPPRPRCPPPQG